jgi:hypothetical protein
MPSVQSTHKCQAIVPTVIPVCHALPHGIAHLLHIRASEPQAANQDKEADTGAASPVLIPVRLKETLQVRKVGPHHAIVVDHHTLRILVTPEVILLEGVEDATATPSTGIEEYLAATPIGIKIQQGRVASLVSVPSQIDKAASPRAPLNGGLHCGTTEGKPIPHRVRCLVKFQGRNAHALSESPEDGVQLQGIGSERIAPCLLGTMPVQ